MHRAFEGLVSFGFGCFCRLLVVFREHGVDSVGFLVIVAFCHGRRYQWLGALAMPGDGGCPRLTTVHRCLQFTDVDDLGRGVTMISVNNTSSVRTVRTAAFGLLCSFTFKRSWTIYEMNA